jgi:hypothetical protein
MSHAFRCLLVLLAAGVFIDIAPGRDLTSKTAPGTEGKANVFGPERFSVTLEPTVNQITKGSTFQVTLRVVNSSAQVQTIRVWDCSWEKSWKSSNPRIEFFPHPCWDNARIAVRLQPGEAYEKVGMMVLHEKGRFPTESLRMGFTPLGERKTYWSSDVVLGVN